MQVHLQVPPNFFMDTNLHQKARASDHSGWLFIGIPGCSYSEALVQTYGNGINRSSFETVTISTLAMCDLILSVPFTEYNATQKQIIEFQL